MTMQRQQLTTQLLIPTTLRMVHARGYNNFEDTWAWEFHEINMRLVNARTTPDILNIYKLFNCDEKMTPEQIMLGFKLIAMHDLEKSPPFWNMLIPLVKKQLLTLDR